MLLFINSYTLYGKSDEFNNKKNSVSFRRKYLFECQYTEKVITNMIYFKH